MTLPTARGAGQTGARGILSGSISNGETWHEDVGITENSTAVTSADTLTWQLTVRESYTDAPVLTLSTDDSTLVIVQGSSSTTLEIRASAASLSALEGDYICDLASKAEAGDGRIIHWLHGTLTFRDEPVWSS